ncbi:MAG TPA: LysE family translocator [Gaiellaceae bacterium]|nr:LysE family translocator [Gaiellaceae bacterium]
MLTQLAAFAAVSAVVICTPGQDTALTIRNTLLGGRRSGVLTAVGVAAGQAAWTLAAALGLVAILSASQPLFLALRLAGAAYLVLLGLQSLRAVLSRRPAHGVLDSAAGALPPARAFRQGLVSNLANPKMVVFFTSLLPQFVSPGGRVFLTLLLLGLAFCALTLAWLSLYAVAVARTRRLLERPRVRRTLDAISGAMLVALGVRVAVAAR